MRKGGDNRYTASMKGTGGFDPKSLGVRSIFYLTQRTTADRMCRSMPFTKIKFCAML